MKNWKSRIAAMMSFLLVMGTLVGPIGKVSAAPVELDLVQIELNTKRNQVESGEVFTYVIGYSFSSVNPSEEFENYQDVKITLPLPLGVEYIESVLPIDDSVNEPIVTGDPNNGPTLEYTFSNSPTPGDAYQLQVNVRYKSYVTPNLFSGGPTKATISMISAVDDPLTPEIDVDSKFTDEVEVISRAVSQWQLSKSIVSPVVTPKIGSEVKYKVDFDNLKAGSIGNLNIENVKLVDTLPVGSEYVTGSASDGGVYDAASHTVTWTPPSATLGQSGDYMSVTVAVYYPDALFNVGDTVTNAVYADYNPVGQGMQQLLRQVQHGFTDDNLHDGSGIYKRVDEHHQEISSGQTVDFYIGGFHNRSNGILEAQAGHPYAAEIVDMRPELDPVNADPLTPLAEFKLIGINPATFENTDTDGDPSNDGYWMEYTEDNGSSWLGHVWIPASTAVPIDMTGVGDGDVDGVRFLFDGPLPISFRQSTEFKLTYELDNNYVATNYEKIINTVDWGFGFDATSGVDWHTGDDTAEVVLYGDRPLVSLLKEVVGDETRYLPGDIVEYELTITNTDRSTATLVDPIVMDVLPEEELVYIPNSWIIHDDGPGITQNGVLEESQVSEAHIYSGIPTIPALKDYTLLRAQYNGELEPSESFKVRFKAQVKDHFHGNIRNRAELTTTSNDYINDYNFALGVNPALDSNDHDGDGSSNEQIVYSIADITVNEVPYVRSIKEVRGELDVTDWSLSEEGWKSLGTTTPGGRVEYRLKVKNQGNVTVGNVIVVDVLPRVGDQAVNSSQTRGSKWGTVLTGTVDADLDNDGTDDISVYYSTATNVKMSMAGDVAIWSLTPPADLTTVTALKFDFGALQIVPGNELSFTWPMRAPFDAPIGASQIAWNSFAHKSQPLGHPALTSAEPAKVGVKVQANEMDKGEIGNYVWADVNRNGLADDVIERDPALGGVHPYGPDGKPGINGVRVDLLRDTDLDNTITPLQTTVTSDDMLGNPGYYLFTNLDFGTYRVRFHLPDSDVDLIGVAEWGFDGWTIKGVDADPLAPNDNDSNVGGITAGANTSATLVTDDIIIDADHKIRHDIDAGLIIRDGELGDYVWLDADWDGIQDENPTFGVNGITATLYKYEEDEYVAVPGKTMLTENYPIGYPKAGEPGYYNFNELPTGTYKVEFTLPTDHIFTQKEIGVLRTIDSNVGTDIGTNIDDALSAQFRTTAPVWLGLGAQDYTIDAGLVSITDQTVSVGDFVWVDYNNNGIQEVPSDPLDPLYGKEIGLNDVTVRLYENVDSTVKATTQTKVHPVGHAKAGEPGYYLFEHLQPGNYRIEFDRPSTNYMFAEKWINSATDTITGTNDSDVNAVFVDSIGKSDVFNLNVMSPTNLHVDAGLVPLASIGDKVWMDYNKDGIQDDVVTNPREIGIANVPVMLYKASNYLVGTSPSTTTAYQTTTTNSAGIYKFDNLEPDINYIVKFGFPTANPSSYPAGYPGYVRTQQVNAVEEDPTFATNDSDTDSTSGITSIIRPIPDEDIVTVDAGLIELASIGDYVWIDMNENGTQDLLTDLLDYDGDGIATDEPGLNGVTVHLLDAGGLPVFDGGGDPVTTVTANHPVSGKKGFYLFSHLAYNTTYKVKFDEPLAADYLMDAAFRGWTIQGTDVIVVNDSNVGDDPLVVAEYGISGPVTVGVGEHNITIDAGILPPLGKLGDYVWLDEDWDGIQDTEDGINVVTVNLLHGDGTPVLELDGITPVTTSTATEGADDGYYEFDNLQPGQYRVEYMTPTGAKRLFTVKEAGVDTTVDSNATVPTVDLTKARTDIINLGLGKINMTIDAGLIPLATIGDTVWLDYDEDGTYNYDEDDNPNEVGVSGVTVRLYKAADSILATAPVVNPLSPHATTTTDADGNYEFTDLQPNYNYIVEFVKPAGYKYTSHSAVGTIDADDDSDADIATGLTETIRPGNDDEITKVDAGLIKLVSVGNYVWMDMDSDGTTAGDTWIDWNGNGAIDTSVWMDFDGDTVVDAGETLNETESGLNGITVNLYKQGTIAAIATTTTQDDVSNNPGYYLFSDLDPGYYAVEFVAPTVGVYGAGVSFPGWTTKGTGTAPTASNVDSNANTNGKSDLINLKVGDHNMTIDAGLLPPVGKLGDYVWLDEDWDGIQDVAEEGINAVTVNLLHYNGTTDNDTPVLELDGITPVTTTTATDGTNDGYYEFNDLMPGQYIVEYMTPTGAKRLFTVKEAGSDTISDSNAIVPTSDLTKARTDVITLGLGKTNITIDAGLKPFATIGDKVWSDYDEDGTYNYDADDKPNEVGVSGVTVRLYKAANSNPATAPVVNSASPYATATTDADGNYEFIDLQPNYNYLVEFVKPSSSIFTTHSAVGTIDADDDSDADIATGLTETIRPGNDDEIIKVDAGIIRLVMLGDYVWHDVNGNGIQESGEPGINGVTVNLYNAADPDNLIEINSTLTVNNGLAQPGYYEFTNLLPGDYIIEFERPTAYPNHLFTNRYIGINGEDDSNAGIDGRSGLITLNVGESDMTIDAGVTEPASIGNFVWIDEDGNGIQGASEQGMNDVTVELYDVNNVKINEMDTIDHPSTNEPGYYLFDNLLPGNYMIKVITPALYMISTKGAGSQSALDSDIGLNGNTEVVTLAPGEANMDMDAGILLIPIVAGFKFVSLGDYVWNDDNRNGLQDADEQGVSGVTVQLFNENNALIATTVTSNTGYYKFDELMPTYKYSVKFILPAGYKFTDKGMGTDPKMDSNADKDGRTELVTLWSDNVEISIDAGLVQIKLASVGNYVWYDKNEDGLQNNDERGINFVTVQLFDNAGNLFQTMVTAPDENGKPGYYQFTNLSPGTYQVKFVRPTGMKFTQATTGTNSALDSNPSVDGSTIAITLVEADSNITIDAGIVLDAESGVPPEEIMEQLDNDLIPDGIPELPEDDGNTVKEETAVSGNDKTKGQLPKTGESAPVLPWLGVLMMATAVVLWWRRRLTKNV